MSIEEENKAKQRRVFEELINQGHLDLIPEFFAPNYVAHTTVYDIQGADGFGKIMEKMRTAFPDVNYTVNDMFAERDKVATRYTLNGIFKGEYWGIAPTGKKFTITGTIITRWEDGKEVEAWENADILGFYQQVGITPPSQ